MRQLGTLLAVGTAGELTDGQLLERFATRAGDAAEQAFATLVERHGPMVLLVCRGVLIDPNDVEDAFQATFLVLVQKARSLWVCDSLGPWLHQVALRTASCARSSAARRQKHERVAAVSERVSHAESHDDLGHVLHEEIDRLPERFRMSVILCDLEGRTHEQAARHLGWPVGTVKSRLTRARERLRDRLTRRGVSPSAGVIALLRPGVMEDLLPGALVQATTSAAVRFGASRLLLGGSAAILAQGVVTAMSMTRWWKIASLLLVAGATVSGAGLLSGSRGTLAVEPRPQVSAKADARAGDASSEMPVAPVNRGMFRLAEPARGSLEASKSWDLLSEVEGLTTIVAILPEGTKVKKGDWVCELDSSPLRDPMLNQKIATQAAKATYNNARLTREVAEIAVVEYEQGVYPSDLQTIQGELKRAELGLPEAEATLERTRRARQRLNDVLGRNGRAVEPGDIVAEVDLDDRVNAANQALSRERLSLEIAQAKLNLLLNYTRGKTIKELKTEVEKARSDELVKELRWELEKEKEGKLQRQINGCKLYAPSDGFVVYAPDPKRAVVIEEGATVRERQRVISVLHPGQPMLVNARVGEPRIHRVQPGQKTRVQVHAFPGQEFSGVVTKVSPRPDPGSTVSNRKFYLTWIKLDGNHEGLRPGMSAEVEINLAEHENALTIPIDAILSFENKDHVAVKKPDGGFEWREVIIGEDDYINRVAEIKQGIEPGEQVALKPSELMSEYEKRQKGIGLPTKPAARKSVIAHPKSPAAKK